MAKYDFYIAGRWRNKDAVRSALDVVRQSGHSAYCFIENLYEGEEISFNPNSKEDVEAAMSASEDMSVDDPMIRKIFENDIRGEREAENFILVLPAGINAHIEAGIAYGMGKKCYSVGKPEKTETLYCLFEKMFPDDQSLREWLETK